ncbi:MAG: putative bifunctional diguanylate cyclase/phosphodiesterase [Acidithiobacillus sp.]
MLTWLYRAWLLFLVVVLVAGGWLGYADWQQIRHQYGTNLLALAAAVADGTHLFLNDAHNSIRMLGNEVVPEGVDHPITTRETLENYLVFEHNFAAIGVRSWQGSPVAAGADKGLLDALLSPSGRGVQSPLKINPEQHRLLDHCWRSPGFCMGPPVQTTSMHSREGAWMVPLFLQTQLLDHGVPKPLRMVVLLPLQNGQLPFWAALPLPQHGSIFLLRNGGVLESRYPPPTKTSFSIRQNGIAAQSIFAHQGAQYDVYYGLATAVNQWRLGAWYRVPGYSLVAGVALPRSVLVAAWWNRMTGPLAAMLALLLLSTLGYLTLRRVARERIQERDAAETSLWEAKERAEVTLLSIGDAVVTTDIAGRVTDLNPVAETLMGYPRAEMLGKPLDAVFKIVREGDHAPVANPVQRVLQEGKIIGLANHTILITAQGEERAIEDSAAPIRARDGTILGAVLVFHDVTEKRRLTADLAYQATHDLLTGLPNRTLFLDRLQQASRAVTRQETLLLVGILDLDGFKQVNDGLGHDMGDILLQEVARRTREALRTEDTIARLGGDEFGLVLPEIHHMKGAQHLANRLLQAIAEPILLDGNSVTISGSLGITVIPWDDGDQRSVLRHADMALYAAKNGGRNQYRFYEKTMDAQQEQLMEEMVMTQAALEDQRLIMYYQPVVSIHDGAAPCEGIIGFEALIRMAHPQRGILPPVAFAEALDHPRLARRIGCFVFDAVLAQGEQWHRDGLPFRMSMNVSARHLLDPRFLDDIRTALAAHPGIPSEMCEIEVTESAPMLDFPKAQETLRVCNELGLRIALDDFGTGSASLSYLQKLPAQTIKVDQSFVRDILNDPRDFAIVAGVTTTANMLGLEVVAEGVETIGHLQLLETLDCHAMQGYLFSKPMPADEVPGWVKSFNILNYKSNLHPPPPPPPPQDSVGYND